MLLWAALLLQDLPSRALPAHPQRTTLARLTPDGKLVLTLGEPDRVVKVWRLDTGKVLHSLGQAAATFALHPEGGLVAVGGDADTAVWNLVTGERTRQVDLLRCVALGWAGADLTTVAPGPGGLVARAGERKPVTIPTRKASWAVVAPDGLHVAVPHEGLIRVWDLVNDKVLHELPGRAIAFGPRTIATAGDGAVRLWDGGKELRTLEATYENTPALAFAGDVLLVGADTGVEIWDGGHRRPLVYRGPVTGLFYPATLGMSGSTLIAGGALILKDAPASGRVTGPLLFWKVR